MDIRSRHSTQLNSTLPSLHKLLYNIMIVGFFNQEFRIWNVVFVQILR